MVTGRGAPGTAQNWLLVGTDSRAGTGDQYGGAAVQGQRSDTTIVAHFAADGSSTLMSIPRDTLVSIPAYTDDHGVPQPARMDKFNSAIQTGGPSLIVRTVEGLTGIRIDHYASVDLAGFKQISEAIGGVTVCVAPSSHVETGIDDAGHPYRSTNLSDVYSGWHGQVGEQAIQGDLALAYVRQRHGLPGGDIARIQRQQQFLGAAFRQATTSGTLLNPVRVASLLAATSNALTLDQNTSVTDLQQLAKHLHGVGTSQVQFVTPPTRGLSLADTGLGRVFTDPQGLPELVPTGQPTSVGNVQLLDPTTFQPLLARLKDQPVGPVAAQPGQAAGATPLPPSQVLVTVENGTTTPGTASRISRQLAAGGFRTGTPAPANRSDYTSPEVRYPLGGEAAGATVAAAVPGATLIADPTITSGVTLIVGATPITIHPVHVAAPVGGQPPASGPSDQAPPPSTADPHCTP